MKKKTDGYIFSINMKKSVFVFVLINLFYIGNGQVRENMIIFIRNDKKRD